METRVLYGDVVMLRLTLRIVPKLSPLKPIGFILAACSPINKCVALPFNFIYPYTDILGIPISYDYPLPRVFRRFFRVFIQAWIDIPVIDIENNQPGTFVTGCERFFHFPRYLVVTTEKTRARERITEVIR